MPEDSGRRDVRNRPSKDGTQSVTRMLAWAEALHDNTALARRIQATSWTNDPRSSAERARTPEDNACRNQQQSHVPHVRLGGTSWLQSGWCYHHDVRTT